MHWNVWRPRCWQKRTSIKICIQTFYLKPNEKGLKLDLEEPKRAKHCGTACGHNNSARVGRKQSICILEDNVTNLFAQVSFPLISALFPTAPRTPPERTMAVAEKTFSRLPFCARIREPCLGQVHLLSFAELLRAFQVCTKSTILKGKCVLTYLYYIQQIQPVYP